MMAVRVSNEFLSVWPDGAFDTDGVTPLTFEYVTKWSGGCFRDMSAGQGGFCLLEDSDVNFSPDETRPAYYIYFENACDDANDTPPADDCSVAFLADGTIPVATPFVQNNTNRHMNFYRLDEDDFDTFEGAWASHTTTDADTSLDDGRCFQKSIEGLEVDQSDPTLLEFLDYPKCV